VGIFLKRPKSIASLPEPVPFSGAEVTGLELSARQFSAETGDISPQALDELVSAHGPDVGFSRFGKLTILLSSPELVIEILGEKAPLFVKGEEERALAAVIGWGLLVQEGEHHKTTQRGLNPGMRGEILDHYLGKIDHTFSSLTQELKSRPKSLLDFCREASQSVAETSLFGIEQPTQDFGYHRAVLRSNKFVMSDMTPGKNATSALGLFLEAQETIHDHVQGLLSQWEQSTDPPPSFMDYITATSASAGDDASPRFDQASMFLQAATETTASLISWTLIHLSGRKDLWESLHEEAVHLGDHPLTHDRLKALVLHQAVIKESLRIAPPVWMFSRVAAEDLRIGRYAIPRGTRILLSPWVTQRSEGCWDRPRDFVPERWLTNNDPGPKGCFFPFGLGRRICIGESYGRMTAAAMLFHLSRQRLVASVNPADTAMTSSHLLRIPRPDLTLEVV
jgi:cytochrome P450